MLKICLCADNHGHVDVIEKIKCDNIDFDYYYHMGDSEMLAEDISPFVSVKGNNDYEDEYDRQKIVELNNHRILMLHGTGYTYSLNLLVDKAKHEKCDVVFFGHTHIFYDEIKFGIRLINPGSCFYNRDLSNPCYARVYLLDDGSIKCERIDL